MSGVDDGAADSAESSSGLAALHAQGVRRIVTTPHFRASLLDRPASAEEYFSKLDIAWESLRTLSIKFPELTVGRGTELMLDVPQVSSLDSRIRLDGTNAVLVEFAHMVVPPKSEHALFDLRVQGYVPVLAHPERYQTGMDIVAQVKSWRAGGAVMQANSGSVTGQYGPIVRQNVWKLFEAGCIDILSSDYHSRGLPATAEAIAALDSRNGTGNLTTLLALNAQRLLDGKDLLPIPPLARARRWWRRKSAVT